MGKKKSKGRRPLKVKVRLEMMIRAKNKTEALGKLEDILITQMEGKFKSFEKAAPGIIAKLLRDAELGMNDKWWNPKAPRDYVLAHYNWTNRKRGGWKREEKDVETISAKGMSWKKGVWRKKGRFAKTPKPRRGKKK